MPRWACCLQSNAPPASYAALDLTILHRDACCVVVNKPSGAIVHRGLANDAEDVMRSLRDQIGMRVYPAHRLDRGTSGALVFALSSESAGVLGKAFEEGRVEKVYWAITRGRPQVG